MFPARHYALPTSMKYAAIDAPCARCSHDSESAELPSRWWRIACSSLSSRYASTESNTERRLEIAELKTHIEKAGAADQIDMREWINDGF